jgi:hypothetical protein
MSANSNNIMGQLKEKLLAASQEEIAKVLKEAQAEALQEAKELLKERMLEAILKDAIGKVNRLTSEPSVLIVDEQSE